MPQRRRRLSSVLALTAGLVLVGSGTGYAVPAQPPAPVAPTKQAEPPASTVDPRQRDKVLPKGWNRSEDLAWTTSGDAGGFHILTAPAKTGYTWRNVATLSEPGFDTDMWVGNACMTESGQRLVVTYAPRTFVNKAQLFDRGGFVAVVHLGTGAVSKLPVQSSLAYFSPGCGTGEAAVVTQLGGSEGTKGPASGKSRLVALDAAQATLEAPIVVEGEVTSALPTRAGIVAADATGVVTVARDGKTTPIAASAGVPFNLAADGDGGVVFSDRPSRDAVRVRRVTTKGNPATAVATGKLGDVGIARGASGRLFVTGKPQKLHALPSKVSRVDAVKGAAISTEGQLAVTGVRPASPPASATGQDAGRAQPVTIDTKVLGTGKQVTFTVDAATSSEQTAQGATPHPKLNTSAPEGAGEGRRISPHRAPGPTAPDADPVDVGWCAVPRNDPRNQAMQPKPRQVEWAVDQAVTGSLYVQREANWKNLGMPAYRPQDLFPSIPLDGGGRVPAQILLGVAAQESNMWQASRVAVPGVTANPLVGNFYGLNIYDADDSDDWDIHWEDADCGYGVTQVTDGMRRKGFEKPGETALPYNQQRAIALDFAANIAAGLRILQDKWNQTRRAGLIANSGDPAALESWFFALWAYNSGFYPDKGNGSPWGVGWANNPANPRYPADRTPFLSASYADAKTPNKWPYPERVLGFAAYPPDLPEAPDTVVQAYRPAWWTTKADRLNIKPPSTLFCDTSNQCSPGTHNPNDLGEPQGPCTRTDLKCWYHKPVKWKEGHQGGNELLRFDPGYTYQADATSYAPRCTLDGLPAGALIIDDTPDGTPSVRPDCPKPWTNAGHFDLHFATDASGNQSAKIDLHQIGGGFGGHFYFSHTRNQEHDGDRMKITGTWTLNRPLTQWARVLVHIPDHGAHTQQANYTIDLGNGVKKNRVILQRTQEHRWVSLGAFPFNGTPTVALSTATRDGDGTEDVAWDAIAFAPLPDKPANIVVALGDSYSSGEGAEDYSPESDNNGQNDKIRNACHRSRNAWSRKAALPAGGPAIGAQADSWSPSMDYHMLACSGAQSENLLPRYAAADGERPTNATGQAGIGSYHELSQLDRGFLDENTTLVTLSIGGNDVRFADILQECIAWAGLKDCQNAHLPGDTDTVDVATKRRITEEAPKSIRTVLEQIHRQAPNAKILLMGYPKLFTHHDADTCMPTGISMNELTWMNTTTVLMATHMRDTADRARQDGIPAWFSDPTAAFEGKGICGYPRSGLNEIVLNQTPGDTGSGPSAQSYHPNQFGTSLYADAMNATLREMGL